MRNTLGFLFVGALLASAATMVGCGSDSTNNNVDMTGSDPDLAMAANPCGAASLCTKSTITDQTFNLSDSGQTGFDVIGAPGYSGMVNVTMDRSSIDSLSGGKDPSVGIAVVPSNFQMTAGASKHVDIKFSTTTDAAAFAGKTIKLHVADAADATKSFDVPLKLTVNAQLTIAISGGGVAGSLHTWSTDSLADPLTINVRARPVTGTTGGTTFIFLNKDTGSHEIHASAPLTHQAQGNYNVAPNPTTNQPTTAPQGTYQLNLVDDARSLATQTGAFYGHNHQGGNVINGDRKVRFIP